jgi:hypothetical protein
LITHDRRSRPATQALTLDFEIARGSRLNLARVATCQGMSAAVADLRSSASGLFKCGSALSVSPSHESTTAMTVPRSRTVRVMGWAWSLELVGHLSQHRPRARSCMTIDIGSSSLQYSVAVDLE